MSHQTGVFLCLFFSKRKSWSRENGEPELNEFDLPVPTYVPWLGKIREHPEGAGIYFQERWEEMLKADPQFLYINDWNEWTAIKFNPSKEHAFPFMRRKISYFFVDQYNAEFNRTIQPMKNGYPIDTVEEIGEHSSLHQRKPLSLLNLSVF